MCVCEGERERVRGCQIYIFSVLINFFTSSGSSNRLDALPSRVDACARRLADSLCQEMKRPALRRHAIRATVQLLLRLDEHEKV